MTRWISWAECAARGVHLCASIIFFNVQHPPRIGLAQCTFIGPLIFSSDQIANQALRIFSTAEGTVEREGRFSLAAPPVHLEGGFLPVCALLFRRGSWAHLHARTARAFCFSRSRRALHQHGDCFAKKKFGPRKRYEYVRAMLRSHFEMKDGQLYIEKIWAEAATVVRRDMKQKSRVLFFTAAFLTIQTPLVDCSPLPFLFFTFSATKCIFYNHFHIESCSSIFWLIFSWNCVFKSLNCFCKSIFKQLTSKFKLFLWDF